MEYTSQDVRDADELGMTVDQYLRFKKLKEENDIIAARQRYEQEKQKKKMRRQRNFFAVSTAVLTIGIVIYAGVAILPEMDLPFWNEESTVRSAATPKPVIHTSAPTPTPEYTLILLPANGHIFHYLPETEWGLSAPLRISLGKSDTRNYLVKVCDRWDESTYMSFFVRAGSSVEVDVPLGEYTIKYACGKDWYGLNDFFGEKTAYAKARENFIFEADGDQVLGWDVELFIQENGNLETERISAEDF